MKYLMKFCLKKTNKISAAYLTGFLFLIISAGLSLSLGSTKLTLSEIADGLKNGLSSSAGARIFVYVRLPRTLAALICGAALSVAGAVIQNVLANRLASPGIIGVNSGAGLAVTLCAAFGIYGGWMLSVFAFFGAFVAVLLVSGAAKKLRASRGTVILLGVAVNSLLGAVSDTVTTIYPDAGVMSAGFKIGEFSSVTYQKLIPAAVITAVALAALLTLGNELDVFSLGEESAASLGMNTSVMRLVFLIFAALLSGCAVSLAGLLSFVGLMVPHAVRRSVRCESTRLLGLCAVFGAAFVCLCDTVARTAFAPYEIPVGIIMSFLGAPFFVFILTGKRGYGNA